MGALDAERDALQAELDRRAEAAAGEASALAAGRQRAEETQRCGVWWIARFGRRQLCMATLPDILNCCSSGFRSSKRAALPLLECRALAAAEARLAAASSRVQEHEAAAAAQRGELEAMAQHVAGVEAEYGALREEYRAVTDDLAALVRENQVRGVCVSQSPSRRWLFVCGGALFVCLHNAAPPAMFNPAFDEHLCYELPPPSASSAVLQSISTQIASLTAERQELADRLAVQATRCQYSEQLAKAREQDVAGGEGGLIRFGPVWWPL